MTKIYLIESSCNNDVFYRKVFTNKKKALAYKNYYDLKNEIEQLGEINKLYELQIEQMDWSEDFENLKMEK